MLCLFIHLHHVIYSDEELSRPLLCELTRQVASHLNYVMRAYVHHSETGLLLNEEKGLDDKFPRLASYIINLYDDISQEIDIKY